MHSATKILVCLSLIAALACGDDDETASRTIVDVAVEAGDFGALIGALEATGLDETLAGEGPFTVFAPTDAAFDRLPAGVVAGLDADTLSKILTYHVVGGSVDAATVVTLDSATTVEGSDVGIRVASGTVVLDGAVQVVTTDIVADNGIIHVIDSVLLPPDIAFPGDLVQAAQAYPIFDTLVGAVVSADLVSALQSDNGGEGFTVFAPQNQAFDALGLDLSTLTTEELSNVLLYHVIGQSVEAAAVVTLTEATTLQGSDIAISAGSAGVTLNGDISVVQTDLRTSNGTIHIIDSVLLPPQ